jgi:hypothetical protein
MLKTVLKGLVCKKNYKNGLNSKKIGLNHNYFLITENGELIMQNIRGFSAKIHGSPATSTLDH